MYQSINYIFCGVILRSYCVMFVNVNVGVNISTSFSKKFELNYVVSTKFRQLLDKKWSPYIWGHHLKKNKVLLKNELQNGWRIFKIPLAHSILILLNRQVGSCIRPIHMYRRIRTTCISQVPSMNKTFSPFRVICMFSYVSQLPYLFSNMFVGYHITHSQPASQPAVSILFKLNFQVLGNSIL